MGASCVKSPDGKYYNFRLDGHTIANALTGKGNQWDMPGQSGKTASQMTLGEFIKEAMTPTGLTQEQRIARAREMNEKKVAVKLPGNLGVVEGIYYSELEMAYDARMKTWVSLPDKFTGDVGFKCEAPEKYFGEVYKYPDEIFINSINSTPDMKITKLLQHKSHKREQFYYKLECVGRKPVVLSFDDWFLRELDLQYNLPTTKKALEKAITY